MDCVVHGVTKSQTTLSDFDFSLSVVLSLFSLLCSHHHYPSPELLNLPHLNSTLKTNSPFPSPPHLQPLVTIIILAFSMNLTVLNISYKGII